MKINFEDKEIIIIPLEKLIVRRLRFLLIIIVRIFTSHRDVWNVSRDFHRVSSGFGEDVPWTPRGGFSSRGISRASSISFLLHIVTTIAWNFSPSRCRKYVSLASRKKLSQRGRKKKRKRVDGARTIVRTSKRAEIHIVFLRFLLRSFTIPFEAGES